MRFSLDNYDELPMLETNLDRVRSGVKTWTLRIDKFMFKDFAVYRDSGQPSLIVRLRWLGEQWWPPTPENRKLDLIRKTGYPNEAEFTSTMNMLYIAHAFQFFDGTTSFNLHSIEIKRDLEPLGLDYAPRPREVDARGNLNNVKPFSQLKPVGADPAGESEWPPRGIKAPPLDEDKK